jgi:lysophospholipid acyltransferase (LPLAT)-like uncharacterized protein
MNLKVRMVEWLGSAVFSILGATLRFQIEGDGPLRELKRQGQPVLYTIWHAHLLPLAYLHRGEGIVVLVSRHNDGEYIARVVERRGFRAVRGSSSRGGAEGLRGLVRAARAGHDLAITPDGPRGPAQVVKPGTIVAAQLSGLPIIPFALGGSRIWRMRSWDRFIVPKPFATLQVRYGEPIRVPRRADPDTLERLRLEVEESLNRLTASVEPPP